MGAVYGVSVGPNFGHAPPLAPHNPLGFLRGRVEVRSPLRYEAVLAEVNIRSPLRYEAVLAEVNIHVHRDAEAVLSFILYLHSILFQTAFSKQLFGEIHQNLHLPTTSFNLPSSFK